MGSHSFTSRFQVKVSTGPIYEQLWSVHQAPEVNHLWSSQPCNPGAMLPQGKPRSETLAWSPGGWPDTETGSQPRFVPARSLGSLPCTSLSSSRLSLGTVGPLESPLLWHPSQQEASGGPRVKSPWRRGWNLQHSQVMANQRGLLLNPLHLPCTKWGQSLSSRPVVSTLLLESSFKPEHRLWGAPSSR